MNDPGLLDRARTWAAQDPDPQTRAELERLIDADAAELADAFAGRLQFGTAGLRGRMGPGPNRMNRVVVCQAAAGLGRYLARVGAGAGRVLIGYDARHHSAQFAQDSAEILAGAGFEVLLTRVPVPTPLVAYGIRQFGCVAAAVVTASHNPAADNGYKVYLGDGCQIVPPADAEIAAEIAAVAAQPPASLPRSTDYRLVGAELAAAYLDRIATLVPDDAPRAVRWVYTPLHGVGAATVRQAVARAGFPAPVEVAEQAEPDPDFPTVAFPNPEEPGALDLALELARAEGVDLVIANDPDADRCAAAIEQDGQWRMLRGDELGVLLGDQALRRGVQGTYAASVVSGSLLGRLARAAGQPYVTTLTGFKWIARTPGLVFGYEEALGYCTDPAAVRDKDGISALIRLLTLAAELKAEGRTLADRLTEIARKHGVYATDQLAYRVEDLSLITRAMDRLRAEPPATLIGEPVRFVDLADGDDLPPTDAVRLEGASVTVTVRPSGTEPKLKCYLEARSPVGEANQLSRLTAEVQRLLDRDLTDADR